MPQSVTLDVKGLWTYQSDTSGVPPGSQAVALNVNINRDGILEPRRGFDFLSYAIPAGGTPKKLVFWQSEVFAHYGTTFAYYNPASGYSSRGSLSAPTNSTSIRAVGSQNKNLYVTSSAGIRKTDAVATSLYEAGIPKAVAMDLAVAGAGTAVANNQYVTYQYLIGRKDANNNVHFGGVSGLFTFRNTAGSTQDISATCYLPSGLDTTYFVQLYRSASSSTTPPPTEPQLIAEQALTSTDISNGYVAIRDINPDTVLGAVIYTASSQQGIANDNGRPPYARDIAEYKGHMFYADVEQRQVLTVNLLGVGTTGIAVGNTVTISDGTTTETYTGTAATFSAGSKQFIVTTTGSVAQQIDDTVKSLIKCINLASALVYAYAIPTSDANPFPGRFYLEGRTFGSTAFTAVSNAATTAFQPQLVSPATSANTSTADQFKNGLMFSKPNQPEAVPIKNLFKVGAADDRILRIVPLRDGLFIFKESGGLFVLRGDSEATFTVQPFDSTVKLVASDSLAVVNNYIYGLFEAGIQEISDTGAQTISLPVKDQLLPLYGSLLSSTRSLAFGVGSDIDGKYILSVPVLTTDTYTTRQHVVDTFNKSFVTWDLGLTCGGANPANAKLYLGQGASSYLLTERRAFDYTDFADYGATCTITAYSGTEVTINNTASMSVGDLLLQGSGAAAYITAVDSGLGTVTIDTAQTWTLSTADVTHMKGINCKIQWNPDAGGNPAQLKQYFECALLYKQAFQREATLYFSSDLNPAESSISLASASGNGEFGQFVFGEEVFGGEQAKAPKRTGVPRGQSRCSQLSVRFEHRVAYSDFQIAGLSLTFNPTSSRTTR